MNTLSERLRQVAKRLEDEGIAYALAGGVVASLYRKQPRTTNDVDFCIDGTESDAKRILKSLGMTGASATRATLEGSPFPRRAKKTDVEIVVGRSKNESHVGVDFLLPTLPWVKPAIERAQMNKVRLARSEIPALVVEDVVVAKLWSYSRRNDRFQDLDDLKSILEVISNLSPEILQIALEASNVRFPEVLLPFIKDVKLNRALRKKLKKQRRRGLPR